MNKVFWDVTPCRLVVTEVSENSAGSSTARRVQYNKRVEFESDAV